MNKFLLSKKLYRNELATFYSFLIGFCIAIIIGSIILLLQSKNPLDVFSLMLKLSIGSVNSLSNSLNKAIPLILAGLGIAIINSVKLWNIGAEGQYMFGALLGGAFALHAPLGTPFLAVPAVLVVGACAGARWGGHGPHGGPGPQHPQPARPPRTAIPPPSTRFATSG